MFFFISGISLLFWQNKLFYDIHDILRAKDTLTTTCIFRSEKIEIANLNFTEFYTVYFNSSMAKIGFSVISYNLIDM